MKKFSTFLIREMQIKTAVRYNLKLSDWLSSKRQKITSVGKDMDKRTFMHNWWESKLVQLQWFFNKAQMVKHLPIVRETQV